MGFSLRVARAISMAVALAEIPQFAHAADSAELGCSHAWHVQVYPGPFISFSLYYTVFLTVKITPSISFIKFESGIVLGHDAVRSN